MVTRSFVRLSVVAGAVLLLLVAASGAAWGVRRFVAREPERPPPPPIVLERPKTAADELRERLELTGASRRVELQKWLNAQPEHPEAARAWEALLRVGYDHPLVQLRHAGGQLPKQEQERDARRVRARFTGPREVTSWCGSELRVWSLPVALGPEEAVTWRVVQAPDARPLEERRGGARPWVVRDVCALESGELLAVLADAHGGNRARLARLGPGRSFEPVGPELAMWPGRMAVAVRPDGALRVALGGRAPIAPGATGPRRGRLALLELEAGGGVRLALEELQEAPVGSFLFGSGGDELLFGSGGTAESHEGAIVQAKNRVLRLSWPAPGGAPVRGDGPEWATEPLPNAPTELLRLPGGDVLVGTHGHAIYRFGPALERRDPDEVPAPVGSDLSAAAGAMGAVRQAHRGTIRGLALVSGAAGPTRLLSASGDFGPERGPEYSELRWWRLPGLAEIEPLRRPNLAEEPWWIDVAPDGRAFLLGFGDRVELRAVPPED